MSSFARIPALDGVRGLATLMVLFCHFLFYDVYAQHWWWPLAHSGWLGVDLFFALSGFLITGILLHSKGRPNYFREFYRRRALRIFPLYYAVLLFSVFAIVVLDRMPERLWNGYDSLAWFFAFIPNFALAFKNDYEHWLWQTNWAGLSHLWSLAVEEQFYLLWPLIVWLLPRKFLIFFCIGLLAAAPYLREWADSIFEHPAGMSSLASEVLPFCRMDGLAAGSLLAVLRTGGYLSLGSRERSIVSDLTFSSAMILFYLLVTAYSPWRGTFTAITFAGMVYLAQSPHTLMGRIGEIPFLRHIGLYSYGLYVFHQMFWQLYQWYVRAPLEAIGLSVDVVQLLYLPLVFGITYAFARASWKFIEKPFLDLKERRRREPDAAE